MARGRAGGAASACSPRSPACRAPRTGRAIAACWPHTRPHATPPPRSSPRAPPAATPAGARSRGKMKGKRCVKREGWGGVRAVEVKQRLQPLAGTSARLQVACGVGEHEAAMIGRMPRRIHRERLDRARHLLRCRVRRRRSVGLELLRLGSHIPASQRATEAEQPTKAVAQRPNDQEAAPHCLARRRPNDREAALHCLARRDAEVVRGHARRHLRACSRGSH